MIPWEFVVTSFMVGTGFGWVLIDQGDSKTTMLVKIMSVGLAAAGGFLAMGTLVGW